MYPVVDLEQQSPIQTLLDQADTPHIDLDGLTEQLKELRDSIGSVLDDGAKAASRCRARRDRPQDRCRREGVLYREGIG